MVTFGPIAEKTIRVPYKKEDYPDYNVTGMATYNKDSMLIDANGDIRDLEDNHVANFNIYGEGENTRINLIDCLAGKMSEAVKVAEATLADLAGDYPQD